MAKFMRLVENEYIKTLRRVSTIIMLILIILSGIALPVLGVIAEKIILVPSGSLEEFIENRKQDIEYLKSSKPENWEVSVEQDQFLIDNSIYYDDWRFMLVMDAYDMKAKIADFTENKQKLTDAVNKMIDGLKSNDYYKYAENKIVANEITMKAEGAKTEQIEVANWEYKYRIEHKSGPPAAFVEPQDDNITKLALVKSQIYDAEHPQPYSQTYTEKEILNLKDDEKIYEYMLEKNIDVNTARLKTWYSIGENMPNFDFWTSLFTNVKAVTIVGLMMILIAGGIVANEFSGGTIKFLLINPAKRWKVLMAKYFTAITLGYIMVLILYIVSIIASGVVFGFGKETAAYITVKNGAVSSLNPFIMMLRDYLLAGVGMIVTSTLAFAISSMVRSTALSVGIGLFVYLVGSTINSIISLFGFGWGRYLIFSNMDLVTIMKGESSYFGHSVGLALAVIAVHLFVFLLTAWDGFTKREV